MTLHSNLACKNTDSELMRSWFKSSTLELLPEQPR